MGQLSKTIYKQSKGFTLIEIMVTVIIVGVISSLALSKYNKVLEQSYCYNSQLNLIKIHQAAQIYLIKNGATAPSGTNLTAINSDLKININDPQFTYTWTGVAAGVSSNARATRNSPGPSYQTTVYFMQSLGPGNPAVPGGVDIPYCGGKKVFN